MNLVLFVIYVLIAIVMGRFVSVPPIDRNQLPFIIVCAVAWPFTLIMIALLCLILLVGHMYRNWQMRKPTPFSAQVQEKV
jgi:hypothetical protein